MTFQRRVAVTAAIAVALSVLLAGGAFYVTTSRALYAQVDRALREPVRELLDARPGAGQRRRIGDGGLFGERFGGEGVFVQLVARDGTVRAAGAGEDRLPVTIRTRAVAAGTEGAYTSDEVVDGVPVRILTTPGPAGTAVQVARSTAGVVEALRQLRVQLLVSGLLGIGMAGLIGAGVARRVVRPVRDLTDAVETVARTQDLSHRIDVGGQDELARLAGSFNQMLASLEVARQAQHQLVADASHELRTPLTSLRTNIEVLASGRELLADDRTRLLEDVVAQLDEFGRLVGGVVELARGETPPVAPTSLRLDDLVTTVVDRARLFHPNVTIEVTSHPTTVVGEADRLERAVTNLLDNAVKYGGEGTIEVEVSAGQVRVRDHGPGVAPEDLPHVFDRFYRAPSARAEPGSGLGLSIVEQVARAHGGTATVDAAPGGGARFTLALPEAVTS